MCGRYTKYMPCVVVPICVFFSIKRHVNICWIFWHLLVYLCWFICTFLYCWTFPPARRIEKGNKTHSYTLLITAVVPELRSRSLWLSKYKSTSGKRCVWLLDFSYRCVSKTRRHQRWRVWECEGVNNQKSDCRKFCYRAKVKKRTKTNVPSSPPAVFSSPHLLICHFLFSFSTRALISGFFYSSKTNSPKRLWGSVHHCTQMIIASLQHLFLGSELDNVGVFVGNLCS